MLLNASTDPPKYDGKVAQSHKWATSMESLIDQKKIDFGPFFLFKVSCKVLTKEE